MNEKKSKFLPITHEKMTRFWISLDEGVRFVLESINLGFGGEIFIPKMSSIKIVDLARSLDNKINLKIIGIRPGEKIHETLCPAESVFETIEFKKYFVIRPSVDFSNGINKNYTKSRNGELGKKVNENFIYMDTDLVEEKNSINCRNNRSRRVIFSRVSFRKRI